MTPILWAAHVNELRIYITPKGASMDHAVLELDEYINIPDRHRDGPYPGLGETSYSEVKKFSVQLANFHQRHLSE